MAQAYLAYGTLQKGFPNWLELADRLGEPLGRFRTARPHALVVPIQPGCGNPGCVLLRRMASLVPADHGCHVEGDLFLADRSLIAEIDRLEGYDETREASGVSGPYVRGETEVAPVDGGETRLATAYRVRDPARWRALVASGRAELLMRYDPRFADARPKACCVENPGHDGPHDVIDPLRPAS